MNPTGQGASLSVLFDPLMNGWCFAGVPAGPAGAVSVLLDDDVRLSVDAAEPATVVEVAVAAEPSGDVSRTASDLIRAMFGARAANALTAPRSALAIDVGYDPANALVASASALAVAETARRRPTSSQLRDLDVMLHAIRVGHPTTALDASRAAWSVLPAAVALARAVDTYPDALDQMHSSAVAELRARMLVLLHVVVTDDPSIKDSAAYGFLTGFTERLAPDRRDLLAGIDVGSSLAELDFDDVDDHPVLDVGAGRQPVFKSGDGAQPRPMRWTGEVADFASRLGAGLRLLHPGRIDARGEAPGELTVRLPVTLGVETEDLAGLRVRAVTVSGHVLGEASITVIREPGKLPIGIARIPLAETANGRRYEQLVVDVAHQSAASPDARELRRLDRFRATRRGQEAAAAAAAGEFARSARLWRHCARRLEELDEHALSERALDYAERAAELSETDGADRLQADWLTALLGAWTTWARTELARIGASPGPGSVESLRQLVDRLAGWNDPSVELAQARLALGRALRAGPSDPDDPDEAVYQIREAMRAFYDLGDSPQAVTCLRELGNRTMG